MPATPNAMKTLKQQLLSGAVLRYRPPHGFYTVMAGKSTPVTEAVGRAAVQSGLVRPDGKTPHGVYIFTLSLQKAHAMPALRHDTKALQKRPAAVPDALPRMHLLRGAADPKNPTRIQLAGGEKAAAVQASAGGMDGQGAQRDGIAKACKGQCVGCGKRDEGVTA